MQSHPVGAAHPKLIDRSLTAREEIRVGGLAILEMIVVHLGHVIGIEHVLGEQAVSLFEAPGPGVPVFDGGRAVAHGEGRAVRAAHIIAEENVGQGI